MIQSISSSSALTKATEWLDPAMGTLALGRIQSTLTAPATDLLVVRGLHNVGYVTVRVSLQERGRKRGELVEAFHRTR